MSQRYLPGQPHQLPRHRKGLAHYQGQHVLFTFKEGVATISLNRPERKNPARRSNGSATSGAGRLSAAPPRRLSGGAEREGTAAGIVIP